MFPKLRDNAFINNVIDIMFEIEIQLYYAALYKG